MNWNKSEIDVVVKHAEDGFHFLQTLNCVQRAQLMHAIADEIDAIDETLIDTAHLETALPIGRLQGEKARTVNQWRTYADAVATGMYAEARVDKGGNGPFDLRKMNRGLGPVVVFGASNFPFAFSTAGGDTASAIGAGCSVIVKAHPAHLKTSHMMAEAIQRGIANYGAPEEIFGHIASGSFEVGQQLVQHKSVKAVAFTGSFIGGKALFDLGQKRTEPIPVFAEMGSINPVFVLPNYLQLHVASFAKQYVASLVLGVGQFCTNPGVLVALVGPDLEKMKDYIKQEIANVPAGKMLHVGIAEGYNHHKNEVLQYEQVSLIGVGEAATEVGEAQATIVEIKASYHTKNPNLMEEVFGPFGLLISCADELEMKEVMQHLAGQLTLTFAATDEDIKRQIILFQLAQEKCGRLLFQGMPTGVEVQFAMQHGGPYPATTDPRFTSVGPDAVKRFLRPISFQNWSNDFLPDELKDGNSLQINRLVNQRWTKD